MQVQLHPQSLLTLLAIADSLSLLSAACAASSAVAAAAPPSPSAPAPADFLGSRSFLEGLLLPDCEGLVVDALSPDRTADPTAVRTADIGGRTLNSNAGQSTIAVGGTSAGMPGNAFAEQLSGGNASEVDATRQPSAGLASVLAGADEFFDARSFFGSLQSSIASLVMGDSDFPSLTAEAERDASSPPGVGTGRGGQGTGLGGQGATQQGAAAGARATEALEVKRQHDLKASLRQVHCFCFAMLQAARPQGVPALGALVRLAFWGGGASVGVPHNPLVARALLDKGCVLLSEFCYKSSYMARGHFHDVVL